MSASLDGAGGNSQSGGASPGRGWGGASTGTVGMWVFLATDTMGFAGLLLAYAVLRTHAPAWPDPAVRFDRPLAALLTFFLLCSGATMTAAVAAAREGKRRLARLLVAVTAGAGACFVVGQANEFRALAHARHVGLTADHAAALFYVITGYHGLHVVVGVVALAVSCFAAPLRAPPAVTRAPASKSGGGGQRSTVGTLAVTSLYWQFVDVVWIVIFTVLYLLPPGALG